MAPPPPPVAVAPAAAAVTAALVESEMETADGNASDDGILVTEGMLMEADGPSATKSPTNPTPANPTPVNPTVPAASSASASIKISLEAMGFTDQAMIATVMAKHGDDVEACARDLAMATEWDSLLDDLAEMGFSNRELNKTLMMKNDGNIKRTVRDLVEA